MTFRDCRREALGLDTLGTVWRQTQFGGLWKIRGLLWLVAGALSLLSGAFARPSALRSLCAWMAVIATGALTGSLGWAGHGLCDCCGPKALDAKAIAHLSIDTAHILIGGMWPAGLAPLAILLLRLRREWDADKWPVISRTVQRFSTVSLISVVLLMLTGIVNSLPLVGSMAALVSTSYGKFLCVKIAVFCTMMGLGAVNLLLLKPRLSEAGLSGRDRALGRLQVSLWTEVLLAMMVMLAVGLLGRLPPATESCCPAAVPGSDASATASLPMQGK